MNNASSTKNSSKPSKSLKQSHRVEAQLGRLEKAKSEVVPETLTAPASAIELIPASALPPVEKVLLVEAETAQPAEIVPELHLYNVYFTSKGTGPRTVQIEALNQAGAKVQIKARYPGACNVILAQLPSSAKKKGD